MLKRMVLAALLVLAPNVGWAQTQENYLPSKSQLYFRWDGMQSHQSTYDKTAVGKMMQGETGVFLDEFWKWSQQQLQTAAQMEPKVGPFLKDLTKLLGSMYREGLVLGVEVDTVLPPKVEAVLVFPKGAGESGVLLPLIQKIGEETKADVKNTKVGKRFVHSVDVQFLKIGWWAQGQDAILYIGTEGPVAFAKAIDAKTAGIAGHPLYKKVASFKDFATCSRGYFDIASVLGVASQIRPEVGKVIDELGVKGIKSVTFVSGFDGPAQRSVVDVDMPGPRKGLLSLASQKKLSLADLPKLPNDLSGFSASTLDLNTSYGVLTSLIENVARVFDANTADDIREGIKAFEGAIGIDLSKDLFGNFGDVMVSYSSPSDGLLWTGSVVAVQLKDGKKFTSTLDKLIKAIPALPVGELSMKRTNYRGGEIMQLKFSGQQVNAGIATVGVYKNWLIYASYPQPIKGFILRQEGELPAWKADASLNKVLAQFPKEYNSIRVSDPRPTVQAVLSAAPFVIDLVNSLGSAAANFGFAGFQPFDLELIPHSQEAARHLFPNVTIGTDDGKRIRAETRGSINFPF